jgi:ABC-type branched-subunit amino acid transport system substrate-binding protein
MMVLKEDIPRIIPRYRRRNKMKKIGCRIMCVVFVMVAVLIIFPIFNSRAIAAEKPPIKFGCVYPLGGMGALMGKSAADAIEMAVEEINAKGGVLGRPLKCISRDGKLDPETTLRESKNLVFEEKVLWLQVGIGTGLSIPVCEFAGQYGKSEGFLVLPIAQGLSITNSGFNPYVFRLYPSAKASGRALALGVAQRWKPKRLVCISADYAYGHDAVRELKEEYIKVVPEAKFYDTVWCPLGTTDFTPYISKIMGCDAEVVFNTSWGADYMAFVKQAIPYGYYKKFREAGCDVGNLSSIGHLRKGDPYPEGALSLDCSPIWELDNPMAKRYRGQFYKRYGYYSDPSGDMNYGYTYVMANAIKAVGATDIEKIIKHLEGRIVDLPAGSFKIRDYDHQLMIPQWAGIVSFTEDLPHPHVTKVWRPKNPEVLYHTIDEVKEARRKAKSPYVNFLGH